jgi:DNA-binding NarL/FixJ family response regulator
VNYPVLSQGPPLFTLEVRLSPRELQFVELRFGQCLGYKEIASQMNIVERTAKNYAQTIYLKLGVCALGSIGGSTAVIKATKILLAKGIINLEEPQ